MASRARLLESQNEQLEAANIELTSHEEKIAARTRNSSAEEGSRGNSARSADACSRNGPLRVVI
jgi:hypothetical protein